MTTTNTISPVAYFDKLFDAVELIDLSNPSNTPSSYTVSICMVGTEVDITPCIDTQSLNLEKLKKLSLPVGEVGKLVLEKDGSPLRVIVVGTTLGTVVMWDEDGEMIKAIGHNELIPFIGFNGPLSVGTISLIAHVGNPKGQNIGWCLNDLTRQVVNTLVKEG